MLTPIYMLAQKAIDKVIKYVEIKNESNKKFRWRIIYESSGDFN